jgi:hypothetical protein
MRIAAVLLLPAALVAQAPSWDGDFVFEPDPSDNVPDAIKKLTDPMNFALRAFWKKKLEGSEKPPRNLSILKGGNLTLTVNKELPFTAGPGSPAKWKRADGETYEVSFQDEPPAFSLSFVQDDVVRTWHLRLSEDGKTLTLNVTLRNPKLPQLLAYKLQYRKAG